jgi:hypothetical protein
MSQLGLGLNLSKTKGGVVPFNPLSLDPYLLFDTQSSMIGTFENPTLDLDPSKPDTLNVITATRSGVATYTDAAGLIQSADPNTVRVDHVDGVPMILVEPSATNLLPYSEDFSNSWWNKLNGLSIDPTSQILAPDGVTLVSKINVNSGRLNKDLAVPSTLPSTGDYIFSAFYKGIAGETVLIKLGDGLTAELVTLDGTWQRIEVPVNYASSGIVNPIDNRSSGTATEVYIWGAQLELGSVATSYIPTSGSTVTRAADDLEISGSDFSDFYNQSEGTVYAEAVYSAGDTAPIQFGGSSTNRMVLYQGGTYHGFGVWVSGVNQAFFTGLGSGPSGELVRSAGSWKVNNFKGATDGVGASDTSGTIPTVDKALIGRQSFRQLNGHIKRLIYWPYHSDSL